MCQSESTNFKWICIVCEQEMQILDEGSLEEGYLPNFEGGNVSVIFGFGSDYDMMPGVPSSMNAEYQMCICDACFTQKKHLARLVQKIPKQTEWKEIKEKELY